MIKKEQAILHVTQNFQLKVQLQGQSLLVDLETMNYGRASTKYKAILTNNTLSNELQANLRSIEVIYSCLQRMKNLDVDWETGVIVVRGVIEVESKSFQTKSKIILNKEVLIEGEYIYNTLNELKAEVSLMKGQIQQFKGRLQEKIKKELRREMMEEFSVLEEKLKIKYLKSDEKQKEEEHLKRQQKIQLSQLKNKLNQISGEGKNLSNRVSQSEAKSETSIQKLLNKLEVLENKVNEVFHRFQNGHMLPIPKKVEKPYIKPFQKKPYDKNPFNKTSLQLDQKQPYISEFIFYEKQIKYVGVNKQWTRLLLAEVLQPGFVYEYQFSLIESAFRNVKIGVCELSSSLNERNPFNEKSSFCLLDNCQMFCAQSYPISAHRHINENDRIGFEVNYIDKTLKWKINSKTFFTFSKSQCSKVFDFSGGMIPFISLYRKGDIIEWTK